MIQILSFYLYIREISGELETIEKIFPYILLFVHSYIRMNIIIGDDYSISPNLYINRSEEMRNVYCIRQNFLLCDNKNN